MRWLLALAVGIGTASSAQAAGPPFELPVECDMTKVCVIQNYVDVDPQAGWTDYSCGRLSYDGHSGTDFAAPDHPTMERGVVVVAAAGGMVKGARDGMADVSMRETTPESIKGREAGNGVVIDHGDGWETQYSHLQRGSVAVKPGQQVEAGQRLGLIGLSGKTEFPHLDFAVRYQGRSVDPFVGLAETYSCGGARQPLWSLAALAQVPYRASGPLIAGFASERPEADAARRGRYAQDRLPADAQVLVFWAEIFGAKAGDLQRIRISGPDDKPIHSRETELKDDKVRWFAFSGLPRPPEGWRTGTYRGAYELLRDGRPVVTMSETVTIGG